MNENKLRSSEGIAYASAAALPVPGGNEPEDPFERSHWARPVADDEFTRDALAVHRTLDLPPDEFLQWIRSLSIGEADRSLARLQSIADEHDRRAHVARGLASSIREELAQVASVTLASVTEVSGTDIRRTGRGTA